ncbi:MAG: beta-glycosidase [Dysgonamonadaceae bacterium]|jgi:glucosylceramidase|nr:beta-glycosidase [Dysgonamonadaceae bacterium]
MKKNLCILCVCCVLFSCGKKIEWVATTPDVSWEQQNPATIEFIKSDSVDAIIDIANPLQTIDGFGTCFNELGWTSLSILSEAKRDSILHELFAPGAGANFTICRMPVGANDFSRDWYSYNETDGDFEMKNFSIGNDKETLVPFIKAALKQNPAIKLWASPWSPPVWMKDNKHYACKPLNDPYFDLSFTNDMLPEQERAEGYNMFIQDDAYFKAYALYFAKFIEAYRAENINISMVMPQNEFNSCQPFPSCTWQSSALAKFTGKYLGPEMKKLGVELMFGTIERPNPVLVDTVLQDPECSKYITGAGFQWAGKQAVGDIHKRYPGLKIYQTEQECGNGKNTWAGAVYSWDLLKHYLLNGANVYEYWNTSLEEGGMSRWGWTQNSLVTVNKEAKTYKFTYEYYLLKHASHYVLPGARLLPVEGAFTDLLAFKNTGGRYVLIIHNNQDTESKRIIKLGDKTMAVTLKPQSFNTIAIGC